MMELIVPVPFAERPGSQDGGERGSPPICRATSQGAEATAGTSVVVEDSHGRFHSIGAEKYQEAQKTLHHLQEQKGDIIKLDEFHCESEIHADVSLAVGNFS